MRNRLFIFILVVFCIANTMCTVNKNESVLVERLDSLLDSNYASDAPGCAIIISKGDSILYEGARGIADVRTAKPIDSNTVFNIASITKQFTVIGILKLQEMGLLDIENTVAQYLPEFKGDIWNKVKIKHLMSHCSGVPDKRPRVDKDFMLYIVDAQCLDYMKDLDELKFEPGTNYDYINPTFQVLAEIIKRVSGKSFEEFQEEYLFKPAGMTNVRYFSPDTVIPSMAHGYVNASADEKSSVDSDSNKEKGELVAEYTDSKGRMWVEYDYGEETFFGTKADGGIYTSVKDFMCWEKALTNNLIISAALKNQAYTPHIQVTGSNFSTYQNRPNTSYGYGWFIDNTPGRELKIYHTGDNGGFQAYAAKYPESDVHVVMFENMNDIDRWSFQSKIEEILINENIIKATK